MQPFNPFCKHNVITVDPRLTERSSRPDRKKDDDKKGDLSGTGSGSGNTGAGGSGGGGLTLREIKGSGRLDSGVSGKGKVEVAPRITTGKGSGNAGAGGSGQGSIGITPATPKRGSQTQQTVSERVKPIPITPSAPAKTTPPKEKAPPPKQTQKKHPCDGLSGLEWFGCHVQNGAKILSDALTSGKTLIPAPGPVIPGAVAPRTILVP